MKKRLALGAIIIAWAAALLIVVAMADSTASDPVMDTAAAEEVTTTTVDPQTYYDAVNQATFYDHLARTDFYNEVNRIEAEEAAEAERQAEAERRAAAEKAKPQPSTTSTRPSSSGTADGSYWDRMAMCETGGNWGMKGSRYSGGLGFMNAAWVQWGGTEFTANAGDATREQQIIVAERIAAGASQGYDAWACTATVGYP